jgi:hypothetical protein
MVGKLEFVVLELDGDGFAVAVWGPFPSRDDAIAWPGMPESAHALGHSYETQSMREAPVWEEQ